MSNQNGQSISKDDEAYSIRHNSSGVTYESTISIKSIRGGGGGETSKRKRPTDTTVRDDLHYSDEVVSLADSQFSETANHASNNNITQNIRNRKHLMSDLSSPPQPPSTTTNTTTTSSQRSHEPSADGRREQSDSRNMGNKALSNSWKQIGPQDAIQHTAPLLTSQQHPTHHPIMESKEAQKHILQNLGSLCEHYSQDIHFAFIPSTTNRIDLSGSFLRSDDVGGLDFFDLNEKGEILLQPRPPIFPEELPSGMKEHSLRWWGVEDPAVGNGRFKQVTTEDRSQGVDHRSDPRSNGYDRPFNSRDSHDPNGPPPHGGPPYFDRSQGPDRRRNWR
ncbi:hypothetical protein FisN_9Lu105 [Fistulifera solaris]|uniref:Uncharacterized protein n=1 Tax=Fistulifera solaris TaxID=1519565 RepID=A0A1Z5KKM5_FISSO|nr:hypothetical protein FisN_9Lu105 [Fistulifera solaris]|eukprot:GAX26826.1 hypothetical protein FisN_9Lu105 [Fistulifera solaris]